jgi:hypothetical protein
MAPRERFELPTNGLTVRRSTTELPGNAEEARILGRAGLQVKDSGHSTECEFDGVVADVGRPTRDQAVEALAIGGE